jgi:hypothetical protein
LDNLENFTLLASFLDPHTAKTEIDSTLREVSPTHWTALSDLAYQQGVSLRFYQNLNIYGFPQQFPETLRASLREAYLKNALRNMLILRHAGLLLENLKDRQVQTIALKGIYLAENINRSIAERNFGDIDLLVKRADLPKAIASAQECGFKPSTYFDPADQDIDIKHVPAMFNAEGLPLEIHWTLLEEDEPFSIDTTELWRRAVPAKVAGVDVFALSPEDFAAHLCLHFTYQHHLSLGLKGLLDVVDVLRHFQSQFDWERFMMIVSSWQCQRVIWLTFSLVREFSAFSIPDEVMKALQPAGHETWAFEQARTQIVDANSTRAGLTPDLAEFSKADNFFSKLKIGLSRVFLPKRVIARLYNLHPDSPAILKGYFLRFRDLFRGYSQRVWHPELHSSNWTDAVGQELNRAKFRAWLSEEME